MTNFSKILPDDCYYLGHTWEPSCLKASYGIAVHGYKESFKVNLALYLVKAVINRRSLQYYIKALPWEILQSTASLGTNPWTFVMAWCALRRLTGFHTIFHCGFLPGLISTSLAAVAERRGRRGLLAVYCLNEAMQLCWNVAISRNLIKPVKNGEVFLFCLVSACYLYLFRCKNGLDPSFQSFFSKIVGSSEAPLPENTNNNNSTTANIQGATTKHSICDTHHQQLPVSTLTKLQQYYNELCMVFDYIPYVSKWLNAKHKLCQHQLGCVKSVLHQFIKSFAMGYGAQFALKLPVIFQSTKSEIKHNLLKHLMHKQNIKFGAFLATFSASFKAINCLLRSILNKDRPSYGFIAGMFAGLSMFFYRSKTISRYLFAKLCEVVYFKGIKHGYLPYIKYADVIVYSLCTTLLFTAGTLEPHNLPQDYWHFMLKITGGRFADLNRDRLDEFGTCASRCIMNPGPKLHHKYNHRFTSMHVKAPLHHTATAH